MSVSTAAGEKNITNMCNSLDPNSATHTEWAGLWNTAILTASKCHRFLPITIKTVVEGSETGHFLFCVVLRNLFYFRQWKLMASESRHVRLS